MCSIFGEIKCKLLFYAVPLIFNFSYLDAAVEWPGCHLAGKGGQNLFSNGISNITFMHLWPI